MSLSQRPRTLAGERMISRAELEQIVGWKSGTADMRERRGLDMPPRYKLGQAVRYREADVLAWIEKNRVAPPAAERGTAAAFETANA